MDEKDYRQLTYQSHLRGTPLEFVHNLSFWHLKIFNEALSSGICFKNQKEFELYLNDAQLVIETQNEIKRDRFTLPPLKAMESCLPRGDCTTGLLHENLPLISSATMAQQLTDDECSSTLDPQCGASGTSFQDLSLDLTSITGSKEAKVDIVRSRGGGNRTISDPNTRTAATNALRAVTETAPQDSPKYNPLMNGPDLRFTKDLRESPTIKVCVPVNDQPRNATWDALPDTSWFNIDAAITGPPTTMFAPCTLINEIQEGGCDIDLHDPVRLDDDIPPFTNPGLQSALITLESARRYNGVTTRRKTKPKHIDIPKILEQPPGKKGLIIIGSPGLGKSTCQKYFNELGIPVICPRNTPHEYRNPNMYKDLKNRGFIIMTNSLNGIDPGDCVFLYPSLKRAFANFWNRRNIELDKDYLDYRELIKRFWKSSTRCKHRVFLPDGCYMSDYIWSVIFSAQDDPLQDSDED